MYYYYDFWKLFLINNLRKIGYLFNQLGSPFDLFDCKGLSHFLGGA